MKIIRLLFKALFNLNLISKKNRTIKFLKTLIYAMNHPIVSVHSNKNNFNILLKIQWINLEICLNINTRDKAPSANPLNLNLRLIKNLNFATQFPKPV